MIHLGIRHSKTVLIWRVSDSEDTPGFTLVVASAAIAMAVFVNARRDEE